MHHLRALSRYQHLYILPTLYDDNEVVPKADGYGDDSGECPTKMVLAISFNNRKYPFDCRPKEESFQRLKQVLPGEPRWYRGGRSMFL